MDYRRNIRLKTEKNKDCSILPLPNNFFISFEKLLKLNNSQVSTVWQSDYRGSDDVLQGLLDVVGVGERFLIF